MKSLVSLLALFMFYFLPAQDNKFEIAVQAQYSYSYIKSTKEPLQSWMFYKGNDEIGLYNSAMQNGLSDQPAVWEISNQPSFGVSLRYTIQGLLYFSFDISASKIYFNSYQEYSIYGDFGQLYFSGNENRIHFKPTVGGYIKRFSPYFNVLVGVGFNKKYETYINFYQKNGNVKRIEPTYKYFYKKDWTLGFGLGLDYFVFKKKMAVGVNYEVYRVSISPYVSSNLWELLPRFPNGFWHNKIGLRVTYLF